MTIEEALSIVEELTVLKFFPTSPVARATLANWLIEWCDGISIRARWLVDSGIRGMNEYPGPEALRLLIRNRFNPAPTYTISATAGSPPSCAACGDLGSYYDPKIGKSVWCSCEQAERIKVDMPGWLDAVNKMRMPRVRSEEHDRKIDGILKNLTYGYGGEPQ